MAYVDSTELEDDDGREEDVRGLLQLQRQIAARYSGMAVKRRSDNLRGDLGGS
jgi:hypothetical protein